MYYVQISGFLSINWSHFMRKVRAKSFSSVTNCQSASIILRGKKGVKGMVFRIWMFLLYDEVKKQCGEDGVSISTFFLCPCKIHDHVCFAGALISSLCSMSTRYIKGWGWQALTIWHIREFLGVKLVIKPDHST